jgi:SHAQKYF class myb-like DNA-binding protein
MSADHYGRAPYDSNSEPVDDEEHRHTQFLDLTNGEGGERVMYYTDSEEDIEEEPTEIPLPQQPNSNNAARAARGGLVTLSGRVVESGQEHTGRWTREEHEAFLTALNTYGKEWKKVAAKVKTRTVVQTRTHAQKYFQKLSKSMGGDGSGDGSLNGDAEVGVVAQEVKKASAQKKQRLKARSQSTTSAAHLLTHLPSIPSQQVSAPASASVYSSSYTTHGFAPASSLADLPPPPAYTPPPPAYTPPPPAYTPPPLPTSFYGGGDTSLWGSGATTMSIVAPDHETAMRRGFPEPSPAASGKRKLAELAAAQMLAGVAAGGSPPQQHPAAAAALQLHDNHLEGDMTPPPSQELTPCRYTSPPRAVGGGLSLQIVNPETLGITYNETRKRISRQGEPETPWDGQLEQLVT